MKLDIRELRQAMGAKSFTVSGEAMSITKIRGLSIAVTMQLVYVR